MSAGLLASRLIAMIFPRRGVRKHDHWEVSAAPSLTAFFRALPKAFGEQATLYLEGTNTPAPLKTYLEKRRAQSTFRIPGGTILPRPEIFRLSLNHEHVAGFVELVNSEGEDNVCSHIHVYQANTVLLEWYDASAGDPIVVTGSIPEETIAALCQDCGSEYEWRVGRTRR